MLHLVFLAQQVDLGENVDVGQLQLHHGGHGLQRARYEFCGVAHELAVNGVHGCQVPAVPFEVVHEAAEDGDVGVELYLARAVEDEVVVLTIGLHHKQIVLASLPQCACWLILQHFPDGNAFSAQTSWSQEISLSLSKCLFALSWQDLSQARYWKAFITCSSSPSQSLRLSSKYSMQYSKPLRIEHTTLSAETFISAFPGGRQAGSHRAGAGAALSHPLGPSSISSMTSSRVTRSRTSKATG